MIDDAMEEWIDGYKEWSEGVFKRYKDAKKKGNKKKLKKFKDLLLIEMECAVDDSESGLMSMQERETTLSESSYRVYFLRQLMDRHKDEIPEYGWDTLKEMEKNVEPSSRAKLDWESMEAWAISELGEEYWEAGTEEDKKAFEDASIKQAWGTLIRDSDSLAWYSEIYDKFAKEDAFKVQRLEFLGEVLKEVL